MYIRKHTVSPASPKVTMTQVIMTSFAPAGPIAAAEFPHSQLDTDGLRPPGKVGQAALIATMHGGGWHDTAWAGRSRRCRREPEPHRLILNINLHEADPTGGW